MEVTLGQSSSVRSSHSSPSLDFTSILPHIVVTFPPFFAPRFARRLRMGEMGSSLPSGGPLPRSVVTVPSELGPLRRSRSFRNLRCCFAADYGSFTSLELLFPRYRIESKHPLFGDLLSAVVRSSLPPIVHPLRVSFLDPSSEGRLGVGTYVLRPSVPKRRTISFFASLISL